MKTSNHSLVRSAGILAATLVTSMVVASCATASSNSAGSAEVRGKLERLESTPKLADLVPVEIREAKTSVMLAEQPVGEDIALGEYRIDIAYRKVEIAAAKASTRFAEGQRVALGPAHDEARLDARTREADKAHRQAATALSAADASRAVAAVGGAVPGGYVNTVSGSWGLQAGAQSYGYAIFLMTDDAVHYLKESKGWEIGVGPTVVVVDEGVAKNLSTSSLQDDAYAFIFSQQGLMAGISIEGTKVTKIER